MKIDIPNPKDEKEVIPSETKEGVKENQLIDMPNEEYHSHDEYLSTSQIKILLKKPYLYFNPQPQEHKYVFDIGSMIHTLILEPEKFVLDYAVAPKCDKRTAKGKKDWLEFNEKNKDKIVIKSEDFDNCIALQKAALSVPEVVSLLKGSVSEMSYFITDKDGIKKKCKPDSFKVNKNSKRIILDVKSCEDASPDAFKRDIAKWGYHIQAPHYLDVLDGDRFVFIAIEKKPPYMTGIYDLPPEDLDLGRDLIKKAIAISKQPEKYKYPLYNVESKIITLKLPNWVHYDNENDV